MTMKKILFIALMIPCFASALKVEGASDWVMVGKGSTGDVIFIDKQSIKRIEDSVTFWDRTNFSSRNQDGNLSFKTSITVNCRTKESILRYFMAYDDLDNRGILTESFAAPATATWEPIVPGSAYAKEMQFVCSKK